ncbi:ABC transporter substrate-binding protein [Gracilibacillus alcaliphilus]|uniref:ABC transporter substrate-binding protein n=1 Tax=Gracilibacillus alcaliphilus TaxID=1401441 RepID=UPI0019593863|nr:sugar ABC transporter substrate-binding protein [Gracilibacillus alcaliphilus]MBM7679133.1 multiple sugar transport system substrate-binding protein [Gracilibacillus alcaliphilus]
MKKKKSLVLLVLSMFLLILAACSNDSGGGNGNSGSSGGNPDAEVKLTMTAWGNPAEQEVYQRALDAYMEENPEVSIELIPAPGDTYRQQLFTQLQGSQATDLFYVGAEYMAQLIATGRVMELSEFLESDESYVKPDEFAEGLWGPARNEDGIYGTAVDSNPMLIYYNKKVLEEAGIDPTEPQKLYEAGEWNWDNFTELNRQVAESGKYGFVAENSALHHFSWSWTNGGEMYDEDANLILADNEKAQEAFGYVADNIAEGNFTYAGALPEGQGPDAMFMSNQTAFVAAGRWLTPMFSENEALEFDYIPWPTNTGETLETASIATAYLAVGEHSDNVEEAMKFLSYYTSEQGQRDRLTDGGNAVPSVEAADDIIDNADVPEHASYLVDVRNIGQVEDKQTTIPGLDEEINSLLDLLFLGQEDLDTTIGKIDQVGTEIIEEYRSEE